MLVLPPILETLCRQKWKTSQNYNIKKVKNVTFSRHLKFQTFTLCAYLNTFWVFSQDAYPGDTMAIIQVWEFSHMNQSFHNWLSLLAQKDIWCLLLLQALMHSFSTKWFLLTSAPSSLVGLSLLEASAPHISLQIDEIQLAM